MHMVGRALSLQQSAILVAVMHAFILMGTVWQMEQPIRSLPMRLVVRAVSLPEPVFSPVPPVVLAVTSPQEALPIQELPIQEPPVEEAPPVQETVETVAPPKEAAVQQVRKVVKQEQAKKSNKTQSTSTKKEKVAEKKPVENKKSTPSVDQKVLRELQQKLHDAKALDKEVPVVPKPAPVLPQLSGVGSVSSGSTGMQAEEDYTVKLTQHLQDSLRLPDVGEVTIGLRLSAQGKVVGIDVIKKTSALNERYVLDQVPQLVFPAWGKGSEERYFPVTLRSK